MSLQVQAAEYEDLATIHRFEEDAYASSPMGGLLFVKARDNQEIFDKGVKAGIQQWKEDPSIVFYKVVDTAADGEIIAMAVYRLYTPDRLHLIQYPTAEDVPSVFGESALPAASEFFGDLWAGRKRCIGMRPHLLLNRLATAPKHQRRGAGGMLIQKGCDIADELGIVAGLEASAKGFPLYKKYGYVEKEAIPFDPKKYGRDADIIKTICMVREPIVSKS